MSIWTKLFKAERDSYRHTVPYHRGYIAYLEGQSQSHCPYFLDTRSGARWQQGWVEAQRVNLGHKECSETFIRD